VRSALSATHHSRGRQSCAVLGRAAYSADPSAAPPQDGSLAAFRSAATVSVVPGARKAEPGTLQVATAIRQP